MVCFLAYRFVAELPVKMAPLLAEVEATKVDRPEGAAAMTIQKATVSTHYLSSAPAVLTA